jgi:hypothetical protein
VAAQLCAWLQGAYLLLPVMLAAEVFPILAGWKFTIVLAFLLAISIWQGWSAIVILLLVLTLRWAARLWLGRSLVKKASVSLLEKRREISPRPALSLPK